MSANPWLAAGPDAFTMPSAGPVAMRPTGTPDGPMGGTFGRPVDGTVPPPSQPVSPADPAATVAVSAATALPPPALAAAMSTAPLPAVATGADAPAVVGDLGGTTPSIAIPASASSVPGGDLPPGGQSPMDMPAAAVSADESAGVADPPVGVTGDVRESLPSAVLVGSDLSALTAAAAPALAAGSTVDVGEVLTTLPAGTATATLGSPIALAGQAGSAVATVSAEVPIGFARAANPLAAVGAAAAAVAALWLATGSARDERREQVVRGITTAAASPFADRQLVALGLFRG